MTDTRRSRHPGTYRRGNYTWIAPPDLLLTGKLITRFRVALLSFCNSRNQPYSQKLLSSLTGIPESRLSEYAAGKRPISASNIRILSEVMLCNPSDLIGVIETGEVFEGRNATGH